MRRTHRVGLIGINGPQLGRCWRTPEAASTKASRRIVRVSRPSVLAEIRRQDDDARVVPLSFARWRRKRVGKGVHVMAILCDTQIRELIFIEPFEDNVKRAGKISYGVSSYGYDLRVGSVFKIFTNVNSEIVDPKKFSERSFVTIDTDETRQDHVLIPPNSFALCETVEVVTMPRDCLAICVG